MSLRAAALTLAAILLALTGPAAAEISRRGVFRHDSGLPGILDLRGEIGRRAVGDLRALLAEHPVRILLLDSTGGSVHAALELARIVRERGIATVVPEGAECSSSCAFVFLGGTERQMLGRLGVHRFASGGEPEGPETEAEAQAVTARILRTLTGFGVGPEFFLPMLETPHEKMHWFSQAEVDGMGLVTGADFSAELGLWTALRNPPLPPGPVPEKNRQDRPPPAEAAAPPAAEPPAPVPAATGRPGPSFDCALRGGEVEAAICADPRLAELDHALGKRMERLRRLAGAGEALTLLATHQLWLVQRNACAGDGACVEAAYLRRLEELGY